MTSIQNLTWARASPVGDVRRLCPNGAKKRGQGCILRFGTINIGTMTGRSRELANTLKTRRIDIACVQETKWKGARSREIGEGYKLFYNGERSNLNGIGVIVSEKFRDNVVKVNRVSDRIMSVKIDTGGNVINVVSCYAPQTNLTNTEKDAFWENLDDHLRSFEPDDYLAIGGDLNGHVGKARDGYPQCHGGNGFGIRNDEGRRILDCAEAHDLVVANTYFKKRPSHLVTYTSGNRATQIDFWLFKRRDLKLITNVKVIPSDDIAPQHRLLVADFRLNLGRLSKPRTTTTDRIKWWKITKCSSQLGSKLAELNVSIRKHSNDDLFQVWEETTNSISTLASQVLGRTKPGRRFVDKESWWWNEDVQNAIKAKKAAFKTWFCSRTDADYQRYKILKSAAKRAVAVAKATHYNQLYEDLNTPEGTNDIFRLASARHRSTQDIGQVKHIKNANQQVLREPRDILQRWSEYFGGMCNEEFPHPPIRSIDPILGPVPLITVEEVEEAVRKMKNRKATGPDDIPAEVWKILGRQGAEFLTDLFNRIVTEDAVPPIWLTSITVPIWKGKGDIMECSNYRPIRLLCHTMKIFERILDNRLRQIITITPNQCGFVKGRGTTDAMHAARLLLEKHRERNTTIHMAFLDLEKAFDRVPHDLIWLALRSHGVPEAYIQWIRLVYRGVSSAVRCPMGISPPFAINVGVHQGSALSPLLFILCMDTVTADLQTPHPWSLLYADDVLLADLQRNALQDQVQTWKTRLDETGMRLNITKTEYLECGLQTDGTINISGEDLKKVTQFKYLGSVMSSDGEPLPTTRARVNAAWMKWRQVSGVMCDRRMPIRLKAMVYKSVIRPVALYGSECRPATSKCEQTLHVMEMRMLRWCLGLTRLDHVRNDVVRSRMGVAPIIEKMREGRMRWYGHVMRSCENSVAKAAMTMRPLGERPRGRPKKRWTDQVADDMRKLGVTLEDAQDRVKWRNACRKADPALRDTR